MPRSPPWLELELLPRIIVIVPESVPYEASQFGFSFDPDSRTVEWLKLKHCIPSLSHSLTHSPSAAKVLAHLERRQLDQPVKLQWSALNLNATKRKARCCKVKIKIKIKVKVKKFKVSFYIAVATGWEIR